MAELLYGFHQLRDVKDQPVTDAQLPIINAAIAATLTEYNRAVAALLNLFAVSTTDFKVRYRAAALKRLQPLDENGRARPTKGASTYDLAFPIQGAGDAWGANFVTAQKLTPQRISDWMNETLIGDRRWVADHLLAALLTPAPWTFDDPEHGGLTVMPLANNDAQQYLIQAGTAQGATDNHLLAQTAAISDAANPFPLVHRELTEHPENGGERATVIAFVSGNLLGEVENLAGFREPNDRDIAPGLGQPVLTGTLATPVPGVVRGKVNKVWVVEWASLPDDTLIATTVEGDKALAVRQHEQAALQGFFELPNRNDTPYLERQFQRHLGIGVRNRVGGLAMRFGMANYAVPNGYAAPIP